MVMLASMLNEVTKGVLGHVDVWVHVSLGHELQQGWVSREHLLILHDACVINDNASPAFLVE